MRHLNVGEVAYIQGSGKKPYEIKNVGGVISCSCPAWRNQSASIDMRTCKHIKANFSNGAQASTQSGSVVAAMVAAAGGTVLVSPTAPAAKAPPPCLLAHSWDTESDVDNWLGSYKLDGVRAWWDGKKKTFTSRLGNEYHAPKWFVDAMPEDVVLDGELFAGNGNFQQTVSAVRKLNPIDSEWKAVKFMVFDMPEHGGKYEERLTAMFDILPVPTQYCELLKTRVLPTRADVFKFLTEAEAQGYEGVMLREPGSLYESGRSHTLLKVKTFKDCEVTVTGYEPGKGKHKGRMGALTVRMDSEVEFSVGSGFTDKERENPPAIGSRITVKYQELSKDGVCRFPTYLCERSYE